MKTLFLLTLTFVFAKSIHWSGWFDWIFNKRHSSDIYKGYERKHELKAKDFIFNPSNENNKMNHYPALFNIASYYSNLNRRFIPQYPYNIKDLPLTTNENDQPLIPVEAPPELVLKVAEESAAQAKPVDPLEHIIDAKALRSGDYWDSFWVEDVASESKVLNGEVKNSLRSRVYIENEPVKIDPDSELFNLINKLRKLSPKLIYVINKK